MHIAHKRISLIDILRGIALLGILIMNITVFSNPRIAISNLDIRNEYTGWNYYTWWIVEGLFEGSMRTLFSMLFGASCLLMIGKLKKAGLDAAEIYQRRNLWLLLFGFLNAFIFLWPGDILYVYSLCGLFLYPLHRLRPRYLLLISFFLMLITTSSYTYSYWKKKMLRSRGEYALLLKKQHRALTATQKEEKEAWLQRLAQKDSAEVNRQFSAEAHEIQSGSYLHVLKYLAPINVNMQSEFLYESSFLDALMMMLAGMALFRYGVLTGARSKRFYFLLMLTMYAIGLPLSYYEHSVYVQARFDGTLYLDRLLFVFYDFRRLILCLAHTSLVILIYKANVMRGAFKLIANVGRMAFTNYLMQSIICAFIFYGFGFGLYGRLQRYETNYIVIAIWAFQLAFSHAWMRRFQSGPFEWLWRSLSYWKLQPLKNTVQEKKLAL